MSNVSRPLALLSAVLGLSACLDSESAPEPIDSTPEAPAAQPEHAHEHAEEQAPVVESTLPLAPAVESADPRAVVAQCAAGAVCEGTKPAPAVSINNWVRNGKKTRGSNSQTNMPQNLTLADVDADGVAEQVQYSQNRLFVSEADYEKTGVLHLYLRTAIKRVITGDFSGVGNDQVCLIGMDGWTQCFGISTDRKELWWWFSQGTFIGDNEDSIVGDFTGDGKDEILVYPRGGGAYRMYSVTGTAGFYATPSFAPGNLGTATSGLQLRAGDFNADGRDDLAVINGWGQFLLYSSFWSGSQHTFGWNFTSNSGIAGADDQITVGRIDDDNDEDIVLRNRVTGATRFHRMEYSGGNLPLITSPGLGQISTTGNSTIYFAPLRGAISEPGGIRRDDALVYENAWNGFVRSDARWSGSALTYYWVYTQYAPNNHAGWLAPVNKNWLFLKCKFSDISTTPQVNSFYQGLMFGAWGLGHFWHEASFGAWDVYSSTVNDTWYTMNITNAAWRNLATRYERGQACVNAYGGSTSGYAGVIVLVNGEGDAGIHGHVLMTPNISNSTFLAHEVGHGMGYWDHSFDDTTRVLPYAAAGEYWDHWDIMSAMNVSSFNSGTNGAAGPGLNAAHLQKISAFAPAHRRVQLNPTATAQSLRTNLAALNKPEANGALYLRVGANNNDHYTIEFRKKSGFDQGIARDAVLLHRVTNGKSILITASGPERLAGSTTWFFIDGKWISFTVHSFAAAGFTADVTINY